MPLMALTEAQVVILYFTIYVSITVPIFMLVLKNEQFMSTGVDLGAQGGLNLRLIEVRWQKVTPRGGGKLGHLPNRGTCYRL